jgi:hypothetical protein
LVSSLSGQPSLETCHPNFRATARGIANEAVRWSHFILAIPLVLTLVMANVILAEKPKTSIANITGDPERQYDKEVSISGHVTDSFGALGAGIYQLDDGTGRMWVLSNDHGVPGRAQKWR